METPELKLPNYTYKAKIVNVVDGDTVDAELDCGHNLKLRKRLRFLGIDTWEVRGEEREKGLIAEARLNELLEQVGYNVYVQTVMDATGKYGRVLAWVWIEPQPESYQNINKILLEEGHGTAIDY